MAKHCRLLGRPSRHRQTQPSEAVRTTLPATNCKLKLLNFRRNSVTMPLVHELVAAYELLDRDDRVRVIVLTADHTADAFCSGVRL